MRITRGILVFRTIPNWNIIIEYSNIRSEYLENNLRRHWVECVQEPYFRVECVANKKPSREQ